MQFEVEFATFGPKDLMAVTGLTPVMQRDWRRAGHLPAREGGWAKFSLLDVCAVAVRKVVADAGLGPAFGKTLLDGPSGPVLVASVMWWALEAQDVNDWLVDLDEALAGEVRALDAKDHFGLIYGVTGIDPSSRLRVIAVDPHSGVLTSQTEGDPAGDEDLAIALIIRLDTIGRQLATRAERSLITVLRKTGP